MRPPTVPDQWPYLCAACGGGWCRPAAELLASTDPLERGGLLAEAFTHSLAKRGEPMEDEERGAAT